METISIKNLHLKLHQHLFVAFALNNWYCSWSKSGPSITAVWAKPDYHYLISTRDDKATCNRLQLQFCLFVVITLCLYPRCRMSNPWSGFSWCASCSCFPQFWNTLLFPIWCSSSENKNEERSAWRRSMTRWAVDGTAFGVQFPKRAFLNVIVLYLALSLRWPLRFLFPGESLRSRRRNRRQRQNTAVTWQPPLLRSGGSLDPRETSSGDCGQTRQMPRKLKESSWRISFCQDPQHCGIFLQVAVSDSVHIPECCLLAVLWWNSELRVKAPAAEQFS